MGFGLPGFLTEQMIRLCEEKGFGACLKQLTPEQTQEFQSQQYTIAFNRLQGAGPLSLHGDTINRMGDYVRMDGVGGVFSDHPSSEDGRSWKSSGCTFVDGVLYWVIHRDTDPEQSHSADKRQTARDSSILKSTDYGRSWVRSAKACYESPMFAGATFPTPYFVDYGNRKALPHGADRYVYATSNNGFWDNGDQLILGRVPTTRIGLLNSSDWEFFAGGDGLRDANWVRDSSGAKPVLLGGRKIGETGPVYLPARDRYLMIGWHYPAGAGFLKGSSTTTVWDFYEAPTPWGPWTHIKSHTWSPQGYYCPSICPKFQSADRLFVFTAGDFNRWRYYRLTVVPIDLV
jgi:hypothetical protein